MGRQTSLDGTYRPCLPKLSTKSDQEQTDMGRGGIGSGATYVMRHSGCCTGCEEEQNNTAHMHLGTKQRHPYKTVESKLLPKRCPTATERHLLLADHQCGESLQRHYPVQQSRPSGVDWNLFIWQSSGTTPASPLQVVPRCPAQRLYCCTGIPCPSPLISPLVNGG